MVCGRPAGTGRRFRRCRHRAPMCRLGGAPERRRWRLRASSCVGFGGGGGGVEPGVAGVHVLPVEEDGGEGAAGEDGQRLPAVVGGGERDEQDALGDAEVDPLHEGAGAGGRVQLGGLRAGAGRGDDLVHDACRDEERDAAAAGGQTLYGHRLPLVFGEPRLVERLVVGGVVGLVVGGLVASQRGCGFGGGLRGGDVGGLLRVGLWPDAGCAGVEGPRGGGLGGGGLQFAGGGGEQGGEMPLHLAEREAGGGGCRGAGGGGAERLAEHAARAEKLRDGFEVAERGVERAGAGGVGAGDAVAGVDVAAGAEVGDGGLAEGGLLLLAVGEPGVRVDRVGVEHLAGWRVSGRACGGAALRVAVPEIDGGGAQ